MDKFLLLGYGAASFCLTVGLEASPRYYVSYDENTPPSNQSRTYGQKDSETTSEQVRKNSEDIDQSERKHDQPDFMDSSKQASREANPNEKGTIVKVIETDPSLSILKKLIQIAGLENALNGPGPFIIYAPNDAAFAKLSPNVLADLIKPENRNKLIALLTYHVVPGGSEEGADTESMKQDAQSIKTKTINGKELSIQSTSTGVKVNNANIVKNEPDGTNGIVHVIDVVLIPQ